MICSKQQENRFSGFPKVVAMAVATVFFTGCVATQNVQQIDRLESVKENPRVLLMPPDIRYYLITAGGVPEAHAEWTEAARANFSLAVQDYAKKIGTDLVVMSDDDLSPLEISYSELHNAVGLTVLTNHFGYQKLPTKKIGTEQSFDWSLGSGVAELADEYDADYGLFVFYRDEQASGGRGRVCRAGRSRRCRCFHRRRIRFCVARRSAIGRRGLV